MDAGNMENDHDYVASRNIENRNPVVVRILRRRPFSRNVQRHSTTSSNSDHDYLSTPANSQNDNSTVGTPSGTLAGVYDSNWGQGEEEESELGSEAANDSESSFGSISFLNRNYSDASISSLLSVTSDATRSTNDTASSASARNSNGLITSEASTSSAASRSESESNDNAPMGNRQQEETESTSSPASRRQSESNDNVSTAHSHHEETDHASSPVSRSQSELNDNASAGHRQQQEADQLSSTAPEQAPAIDEQVINLLSPSPPKKRKRLSLESKDKSNTPKVKSEDDDTMVDEDDGLTCPICLDSWEMSGEHRLTSLKCGHLFGESCIRRWLQESARQSGQKVCPQCKTKATPRDLRYLYAKRLRAIDRSEEHRMRDELCHERSRCENLILELATMKMTYAQVTMKIKALEADNQSLKKMLRTGSGVSGPMGRLNHDKDEKSSMTYKLFMERNVELSRDSGCRVMKYADHHAALLVSQKSSNSLFPGYGLRFIDTATFKPASFLHTSLKMVRDISLSEDQQLLAVASMEQKVKLFDLRTLQLTTQFMPSEKPIWSCSIAHRESEHCLYLGSQQGSTYVYDIRYPEMVLSEHFAEGDNSPAIQVTSVPESEKFACGGFLVCKLTSLWFYEYLSGGGVQGTRLAIDGRLISMSYDIHRQSLLVQTRSCSRYPGARFVLGKLDQIDGIPVFDIKVTFTATTNSPVMTRATQIDVDSNTLVVGYIQDSKRISIFDANLEHCIQSLSVLEVVYDTCPVYVKDMTYVAALSESKCRLYKLHSN